MPKLRWVGAMILLLVLPILGIMLIVRRERQRRSDRFYMVKEI